MRAAAREAVRIPLAGGAAVDADMSLPEGARGMVVFAHGSGSSRFSGRNQAVAETLVRAGLGTLLLDLLTPDEERRDQLTAEHRFDIPLLAGRVVEAIDWLGAEGSPGRGLPIGLFGASTGAAAALVAAALRAEAVGAVVSRGGRPDLAGDALPSVLAPTLLIVGGADTPVIPLNRSAADRMTRARCELVLVPGATHLFEEPGALEEVARLARDWLLAHLAPRGAA